MVEATNGQAHEPVEPIERIEPVEPVEKPSDEEAVGAIDAALQSLLAAKAKSPPGRGAAADEDSEQSVA